MGSTSEAVDGLPPFLSSSIKLNDGRAFELLRSLTDLRICHDGTPRESRILFFCKAASSNERSSEFVVKVKIQAPDESGIIAQGPSTTTSAEVQALRQFEAAGVYTAPHLIDFVQAMQDTNGPLPDGYITYTIMTKMPGTNLLDYKFWSRSYEERSELQQRFVDVLRSIWQAGVVPTDKALRNVLWEPESKTMSIVDFESWERPTGFAMDEAKELQAWGLASRPPPGTWIDEWRHQYH